MDDSSSTGNDCIHVEQLELFARLGITEEERSRPQRITVSLTIWPERGFSGLQDDISRAVNYAEVCRAARELVESRPVSLIETLASQIASALLKEFPLRMVEVELRKYIYPDTKYTAVIVRRDATSNH